VATFDPNGDGTPVSDVEAGIVEGAIGWDGVRVLWSGGNTRGFWAWQPGAAAQQRVRDHDVVLPEGTQSIPQEWAVRGNGEMLLVSSHSVSRFRLEDGGASRASRLERLFGGSNWLAIRSRDKTQLLWQRSPLRETELTQTASRIYGAPDGRGFLYALEVEGRGRIWNLDNLTSASAAAVPVGLNVSVGDPVAGCWFADRDANIFYADREGVCTNIATVGVESPRGGVLHVCEDYLVWRGYAPRFYETEGTDHARVFVLFRRSISPKPSLERLGEQWFPVREGHCVTFDFAARSGQLVCIWHREGAPLSLRTARIEEFFAGHYDDHDLELPPAAQLGLGQAALCPDESHLGIVTAAGEFVCVDSRNGQLVAALGASAPFTHIASGDGPRSFWLGGSRDQIFGCMLVSEVAR
jgi:hypothetical protein